MTTSDNISAIEAIEAIEKAMEAATPGVWDVWEEQTPNKADAIAEMAYQVENSDPFVEVVYLLNADGKCPATTGCGPTSAANAAYISACSPERMRSILAEARKAAAMEREIAQLAKVVLEVLSAVRDYLPPDGISAKDCLSRVIGAVDNRDINPLIEKLEHGNVDA